ncbi:beta,beta-carotene 15,15'-dioxygenase [Coccomyxa sp. Obi]|nr:beta,beta-carotene 15,15'-dioxygenase [Coccomyxa sp. Obi]
MYIRLSNAATATQPSIFTGPLSLAPQQHQPPQKKDHGLEQAEQSDLRAIPAQREDSFTDADWDNVIRGYTSQYVERDYWVDTSMIEGSIPAELEGTLLRNGPGLFEVGGKPIGQPFDGDGMVCSWAFSDGHCFFRSRYVRTNDFMAEQEAGRMLYRGAFSAGNPSGGRFFNPLDLRIKSIANTNVVHWGGRTFALHERDLPWELDSALCTLGRTNLGNTLGCAGSPANFGSHVRTFRQDTRALFDVSREEDGSERLIGSSFAESLTKGTLTFWEYGEDLQLLCRTTAELPGAGFGFFHDMLVTEHYYIALENPMRLDLTKMATKYALGRACLAECLKFNPSRRTKVHLIPRPGRLGKTVRRVTLETEPLFCFHHVNAFEDGDERVIMDCLAMKGGVDFGANFGNLSAEFFQRAPWRTALTRLTLDLEGNNVNVSRVAEQQSMEMPCVAPACSGRPYSHAYVIGSHFAGHSGWGPPQDILKVTMPPQPASTSLQQSRADESAAESAAELAGRIERWSPGRDSFAQEAIFVPRSGRGNRKCRRGDGHNSSSRQGWRNGSESDSRRNKGCEEGSEDDGWLLAPVFRSASMTTDLVILDAADVEAGPVATIHLPHHVPIGLHGSFTDAYLGPPLDDRSPPREHDIRGGVSVNGVPRYSASHTPLLGVTSILV